LIRRRSGGTFADVEALGASEVEMQKSGAAVAGFPGLYRDIPTERLLEAYTAAPRRFDLALEGLSDADLAARPRPGKWSIQEIVCHVTDSETCAALRFRLAIAQPGGALPAYDQDRFSSGLDYASFDRDLFARTRELFRGLREVSARLLRAARPPAWELSSRHHEFGEVTLRQLLELYADHGERHLEQVLDRRSALGKNLSMAPMLPVRLY
jgi:hypothetical protein